MNFKSTIAKSLSGLALISSVEGCVETTGSAAPATPMNMPNYLPQGYNRLPNLPQAPGPIGPIQQEISNMTNDAMMCAKSQNLQVDIFSAGMSCLTRSDLPFKGTCGTKNDVQFDGVCHAPVCGPNGVTCSSVTVNKIAKGPIQVNTPVTVPMPVRF